MSLTSYRAAPPRAKVFRGPVLRLGVPSGGIGSRPGSRVRECVWLVLGRPGGDRLSRVLRHSTMGAGVFNGRVRDGIGFWAHRSGHQAGAAQVGFRVLGFVRASRDRQPFRCRLVFGRNVLVWCLFVSLMAVDQHRTRIMRAIKPIGRLVPVSSTRYRACTPGLSTWSSSTALKGDLVLRWVSRLDAFSGYPVRT